MNPFKFVLSWLWKTNIFIPHFQVWARAASSPRPREVPATQPGFARTPSSSDENVNLFNNGWRDQPRPLHSGDPSLGRRPINGQTFWDDFALANVLKICFREHFNKYLVVFRLIKLNQKVLRIDYSVVDWNNCHDRGVHLQFVKDSNVVQWGPFIRITWPQMLCC